MLECLQGDKNLGIDPGSRRRRVALALAIALALGGCYDPVSRGPSGPPVFYPRPPDAPRVQFLTAINTSRDIARERTGFGKLFLGAVDAFAESDALKQPYGVATWQGKVYVADRTGGDVKVFDLKQNRYSLLSGRSGVMAEPTNLCIDRDGYKFIVESMRKMIHVFDPADAYLTTFRVKDGRPGGVAVVGKELFVTDVTGDRILVLDRSTGKEIRTFGTKGKGPGQFLMPNAIAADGNGYLYVSDQMNCRFQKLDTSGKPLLAAGEPGDSYGAFARPRGIAVGPDGVVYVVESEFEIVQMFSQEGKVLMGLGNFHARPGFLELPAGVAVDKTCLPYFQKYIDPRFEPEYLVFVVSQVGATRVGVYAFGNFKEGAELPVVPPPSAEATPPEKKPAAAAAPKSPPAK